MYSCILPCSVQEGFQVRSSSLRQTFSERKTALKNYSCTSESIWSLLIQKISWWFRLPCSTDMNNMRLYELHKCIYLWMYIRIVWPLYTLKWFSLLLDASCSLLNIQNPSESISFLSFIRIWKCPCICFGWYSYDLNIWQSVYDICLNGVRTQKSNCAFHVVVKLIALFALCFTQMMEAVQKHIMC